MKFGVLLDRVIFWLEVQRHNSRVILNDVAIRETFATLRRFAVFGIVLFLLLWGGGLDDSPHVKRRGTGIRPWFLGLCLQCPRRN